MPEDASSRVGPRKGHPIYYGNGKDAGGRSCIMCGNVLDEDGIGTVFGCQRCSPSGGGVTARSATKTDAGLKRLLDFLGEG